MIKCSECGYENMEGLDYCDGCGAKLAAVEGNAAPAPAAAAGTEAPAEAAPAELGPAESAPAESAPAANGAPPAGESAETAKPSQAPTGEIKAPTEAPASSAAATAAAFKAKLSLIRGGRKGQEFPLEAGQNFIGRWDPETGSFPEVDLEQDDPEAKISRKHALIIIEAGKITVEDIGSLNGTYVNRGNRLIPGTPVEVKRDDEIIIGKTFLKLVIDPIS
ncbi:MAG TPA: FHA domain-containing protein [Candidatus Binataceae bacterium]|nr:FHA domain-containing protein [Candidatus Binataceae bacterium]